jgi:hypothetical protein
MKKKNHRKITLNRETLRHLEGSMLADVGGAALTRRAPQCFSNNCGDTWSDCYITACNCDPSIEFYCPV